MLVPLLFLLVLECSSLVTLIDSLSLVEGEVDLLFPFWVGLGWSEGYGDSRSALGFGEIAFFLWENLEWWLMLLWMIPLS